MELTVCDVRYAIHTAAKELGYRENGRVQARAIDNDDRYNYYEAVQADVIDWMCKHTMDIRDEIIENGYKTACFCEWLYGEMLNDRSVTGYDGKNFTGYFGSDFRAENALCHNLELVADACGEMGISLRRAVYYGAEYCDSLIRMQILTGAIWSVVESGEFNRLCFDRRKE